MSLFNDVDTMLGLSEEQPAPVSSDLFSTFLVSPAYFSETDEVVLIKVFSAKGEPFFLLDTTKESRSLVCGSTKALLSLYDPSTACTDRCDGLPKLHLVSEQAAEKLMKQVQTCPSPLFAGLIFVSAVSMQLFYNGPETADIGAPPLMSLVYRVDTASQGEVESRGPGVYACDYPVPYILIDQATFAEGKFNVNMIESLPTENASLIESLCRLQYVTLHNAEGFPDALEDTLSQFMGQHSHSVRALIKAQIEGATCDDAYVRRQRKGEIDVLVRLMMREVELIEEMKRLLQELEAVQTAVGEAPVIEEEEEECEDTDPLLAPISNMTKEQREVRAQAAIGTGAKTLDVALKRPVVEDQCEASSGSECSR